MIATETWSYSRFSCYMRCPAQFYNRYVVQAPEECRSAALLLGSEIHGAVTLWHSRRWQGIETKEEEILASFETQLRRAVDHSEIPIQFPKGHPDVESTVELGKKMLTVYLESVEPSDLLAVEQELRAVLPLPAGRRLTVKGFVDRIESRREGEVQVVELKTAARSWSQADLDHNDQLSTYSLLMAARGYQKVRLRVELLTKTKSPKLMVLDAERTVQHIERLREKLVHIERGVRTGVFPRNQSSMNCNGCAFRLRCLGACAA